MATPHRFARTIFRTAGIYGLIVLLPQYFLEARTGRDFPPPITHPEYYYGFIGVAVAWQLVFLVIARDPARYRLMMLPAIVEKATFAIATLTLFLQDRLSGQMLGAGLVDLVLGVLFAVAFWRTSPLSESVEEGVHA